MKATFTSLIFFALLSNFGFGQTKLISHKSHSGSSKNFQLTLHNNFFNMNESNFGMAPQRFVRNSNLDSVILLSDNVAIMVTSETCNWEDYGGREKSNKNLWSAGRDTVYDHPVFTTKNNLKSIKSTLKEEYYFANSIDSVVFIGFDGNFAQVKAPANSVTRGNVDNASEEHKSENNPKRPKTLFLIFIITFFKSIYNFSF